MENIEQVARKRERHAEITARRKNAEKNDTEVKVNRKDKRAKWERLEGEGRVQIKIHKDGVEQI